MAKKSLKDLAGLSVAELEKIFQNGKTPDPEKLVDWEFKGFNQPIITKILGFRKFKKGFYKKDEGYWGYNIPQYQNGVEDPWRCQPVDHNPKRFGFFSVNEVQPDMAENKEQGALILNYADGKNMLWEGSFLRDYLKQVDPDDDDLYLGKAYIALGPARVFPSFFILERDRKTPTEVINGP